MARIYLNDREFDLLIKLREKVGEQESKILGDIIERNYNSKDKTNEYKNAKRKENKYFCRSKKEKMLIN